MTNLLGWVGGILLAICGIFEAVPAILKGNTGLGLPFLIVWLLGEILVFIPVVISIKEPYLIFNYGSNILFILIIMKYRIFPRSNSGQT